MNKPEINRIVAIVQARVSSTRLPGKALKKIYGKEMLLRVIDRILNSEKIQQVVVATTDREEDNAVERLVTDYSKYVSVFRGSVNNVLDRYYNAALKAHADIIVRITSDCPLVDPKVIDLHIEKFFEKNVDYLSSRIKKRTWPHGIECEVFLFSALEKAAKNAIDPFDKEHVTPYIYSSHKDEFSVYELSYSKDISSYRFTVDYPEDLIFIESIYKHLYKTDPIFGMNRIIKLLHRYPELMNINRNRINTGF